MAWGDARSSPYDAKGSSGKGDGKGDKQDEGAPSDNLYITGLPAGIDDEFLKALFQDYGTVVQCKVLPQKVPGSNMHALVRFGSVEEATNIKNTVSGGTVDGSSEPLNLSYASKKPQTQQGPWSAKGDSGWGGWGAQKGEGKGGGSWNRKGDGKDNSSDSYKGDSTGSKGYGKDGGNGKGGKGGKGDRCPMNDVMKAFYSAKCLPGAELGNEHNCLYVSNLPPDCTDLHLYKIFAPFGAIPSRGVFVKNHPDRSCVGYGFVNFVDAGAMHAAQQLLDGAELPDGATLQVKVKGVKA